MEKKGKDTGDNWHLWKIRQKEVSAQEQQLFHKQQLGVKYDPRELSKTTTAESKLSFFKASVNAFLLQYKCLLNKINDVQDQKK